jgi:hypothetical protein
MGTISKDYEAEKVKAPLPRVVKASLPGIAESANLSSFHRYRLRSYCFS